jgi:hypothetical protein
MPTALGLPAEVKKGDFPYLLSSYENGGRIWDSLPPLSYYNVEALKPKRRRELEEWHAKNRCKSFNYDEEIKAYCQQDVLVLKQSILAFRALFLQVTTHPEKAPHGICPFNGSFTIDSACSRVFRQLFLQPCTLALIPSDGIDGHIPKWKQSLTALKWLKYLNEKNSLDPPIQHARNGGEVRVLGSPVDGFRQVGDVKYIYEFYGDFFHGCASCYSRDTIHPLKRCSMGELHDKTMNRLAQLRRAGYVTISIWECEFKQLLHDPATASLVNSFHIDEPLNPRSALAGGR